MSGRPEGRAAARRTTASLTPSVARYVALAIALTLVLAACGDSGGSGGYGGATGTFGAASPDPAQSGGPQTRASPVTGRVTKIDAEGLTRVKGFTMRLDDGSEVGFTLGDLENATDFPPGHLAEHMASSSAVKAFFRDEGGAHVVYRLEDGE